MKRRRRWALLALTLLPLLLVFALGWQRYGGVEGMRRRVQALWSPVPAHALWVPTPLPVRRAQPPVEAREGQILPQPPVRTPASSSAEPVAAEPNASPMIQPAPSPAASPNPSAALPVDEPDLGPAMRADSTPAGTQAALSGLRHEWQTWNNCGPATLSFQLSYFGSALDQEDVRRVLRPNREDKNVNLSEMAAFAETQGLHTLLRQHGNAVLLRRFISNGLPVLIETWLEPHPNDGMGHYRLLTGFDDTAQQWVAYDSYVSAGLRKGDPYQGIRIPYAELDRLWHVFNRAYLVVYRPQQAALVGAIAGPDADAEMARRRGLAQSQAAVVAAPQDAFAWFNLGSDLTALGQYEPAAEAFDQARQLGLPWRMHWYQFAPFQAYFQVGRYQEVLALADATIKTTGDVEELFDWRGQALAALGDAQGAQAAFDQAARLRAR